VLLIGVYGLPSPLRRWLGRKLNPSKTQLLKKATLSAVRFATRIRGGRRCVRSEERGNTVRDLEQGHQTLSQVESTSTDSPNASSNGNRSPNDGGIAECHVQLAYARRQRGKRRRAFAREVATVSNGCGCFARDADKTFPRDSP